MTAQAAQEKTILRYEVLGARRFSNYWWALVISIGGTGFFLAGLSSYFRVNLLPIGDPIELVFIPQGIAMGFYGVAGLLLATYLWLTILWNVGGGYNEFDRAAGQIKIFRQGYPGKNRKVEVSCRANDVQSIRVSIREGISPQRSLYLRIKGRGDIPLTRVGQPLPLTQIENQAAEIAKFLNVPMEGL
ncbi:MAG: photosystem I assembly protein Ycf4 [Thermosynechococcaceae cyanobacterium MS004]|nr:photosystem I assembly protein Ycf4 [Thermosynechococcaceae cyanobacterium MS004]